MSNRIPDAEVLMTPKEVAQRFHVNPKTVTRWAKAGKLTAIRTLGGHRRYRESETPSNSLPTWVGRGSSILESHSNRPIQTRL